MPLERARPVELARFQEGDTLFEAMLHEADGLGPLYVRNSCAACHHSDGRGPGRVGKMAVVEADGRTRSRDQSILRFGTTARPYATAGATQLVMPPDEVPSVRVTYRLPPAVFGRGYMEAVADEEIERAARAASARTDGIHGRVHRVHCRNLLGDSGPTGACAIGRFGLKARIATLDEFTADAFQNDMGITSPQRPVEPASPEGITDDGKPGIDVTQETIAAVSDYMRLLELPARSPTTAHGAALFEQALCAACHTPSMQTRADYPIAAIAGRTASLYTDFLLHDMGDELSDSMIDEDARPEEWRTAPLVGLRFSHAFLHDGRAHNVEDAIALHRGRGSEANEAVSRFETLGPDDKRELVRFVGNL